jgi:hypothetical protein
MGGLGNQLFQIFTTISYAIITQQKITFLNTETVGTGITRTRNTYWTNLFYKLKYALTYQLMPFKVIREKGFTFNDIVTEINDCVKTKNNVCLYGYFQSYKYFQINYAIICRLIDINNQKQKVLELYSTYNNEVNLKNTVSMHFRLGDYKILSNMYPIMSYEYYEKALQFVQSNDTICTVLFFCEDDDLDDVNVVIEQLKTRFPDINFTRASNLLKDYEQLLLMSCCKHNIIANSSFSWWGAYLNQTLDKIVCYPSVWFCPGTHNSKDLCPPEWNGIN